MIQTTFLFRNADITISTNPSLLTMTNTIVGGIAILALNNNCKIKM